MKKLHKKLRSYKARKYSKPLLFVLGVAVIGTATLLITNAATNNYFIEPETSTLSGNASTVADTTASGGQAVKFTTGTGGSTTTCPLPAYPDETCTGVPADINLMVVYGEMTISTDNTVIEGKEVHGCIIVTATGVIIRNTKVISTSTCGGIGSQDRGFSGTRVLIEDTEIDCGGKFGSSAVGEANITLRRVNIHSCENGLDINRDINVEDSFIHDPIPYDPVIDPHTDGIQLAYGHFENNNPNVIISAALNVTIKHSTILMGNKTAPTDTNSAITTGKGGDTNILIQDNLLAGGGYTLYCEQGFKGINYRVIGNHFSRMYYPNVGFYGASTDCSDEIQSGNVYHETGQPLNLD